MFPPLQNFFENQPLNVALRTQNIGIITVMLGEIQTMDEAAKHSILTGRNRVNTNFDLRVFLGSVGSLSKVLACDCPSDDEGYHKAPTSPIVVQPSPIECDAG